MAIEDLIANGIRPPQVEPMSVATGRAISLRNMVQQGQLTQQQMAENAIRLRQAQRQEALDLQMQDYYKQHANPAPPDPTAAPSSQALTQTGPAMQGTPPAPPPDAGAAQMTSLQNMFGQGAAPSPPQMQLPPQPAPQAPEAAAAPTIAAQPVVKGMKALPIGFDFDGAIQQAAKIGNLQALQQLQTARQNFREKESIIGMNTSHGVDYAEQANKAKAETTRLKLEDSANGMKGILDMPPEQQAAAWPAMVQRLVQRGSITPEEAQQEMQFPGTQAVQQAYNQAVDYKTRLDNQTKAAMAPSQISEAQSKALVAGITADQVKAFGMTKEQFDTLSEKQKSDRINEALSSGRLRVEQGRLAVEQQRLGFDASGGVSPAAQMAADGRMDPQTLRRFLRSQPGLLGQITTLDPKFDEANIENRYNTLKEFTNTSIGKAGGQALALNTLIHHADLYMQTAEALKNGTFKPGNAVYNAVADAFGAAPPTNAALVGRFFASETGKVATGGVPAEGEINGILKNLGTNSGPDQIAGAGKTLMQIAGGRATPLLERAKQAKIDNVVQVLGPDAKSILARRGFDPETMKPTAATVMLQAPDGTKRPVPADQVDHYLKQGAKRVN